MASCGPFQPHFPITLKPTKAVTILSKPSYQVSRSLPTVNLDNSIFSKHLQDKHTIQLLEVNSMWHELPNSIQKKQQT